MSRAQVVLLDAEIKAINVDDLNALTYYQLLGLDEKADEAAIKIAYKKWLLKFHSDKIVSLCKQDKANAELIKTNASQIIKLVIEVNQILMDKKKRASYDEELVRQRREAEAAHRKAQQNASSNTNTPSAASSSSNAQAHQEASPRRKNRSSSDSGSTTNVHPQQSSPKQNSKQNSSTSSPNSRGQSPVKTASKPSSPNRTPEGNLYGNVPLPCTIHELRSKSFMDLSANDQSLRINMVDETYRQSNDNSAPLLSGDKRYQSPAELLEKIADEYEELKSQSCCYCVGFFNRFRSNFFDGAFNYAKENLFMTADRDKLTDIQKLWIVLQYANITTDAYQRTKNAVDNVVERIRAEASRTHSSTTATH